MLKQEKYFINIIYINKMNFKDYIFIFSQDLISSTKTNDIFKLHKIIINKDFCELDVFLYLNTIYNIKLNNNNISFNDRIIYTAIVTPGVYTKA